ncbi:hypothetical protein J7E87_00920 [Streptomyces sp. ISL-1]|uniref:hypothetical protein n=1 Tax=Streptomyces sp. ISL-1 TaxID=2817657 RepID=UPI001BE5F2EA|nr:hypothetical protein [Streptomyces sp. ISL-1]MBT2388017.1 hypothetical protein [Streptomyces sp. ISL-1]
MHTDLTLHRKAEAPMLFRPVVLESRRICTVRLAVPRGCGREKTARETPDCAQSTGRSWPISALDTLDPGRADAWTAHLLAMDWDDPEHRRILELEGLKRWVRPELDGYADLFEAVEEQHIAPRW